MVKVKQCECCKQDVHTYFCDRCGEQVPFGGDYPPEKRGLWLNLSGAAARWQPLLCGSCREWFCDELHCPADVREHV